MSIFSQDTAVFNKKAPSLGDGQQVRHQADSAGNLKITTEGGKATYYVGNGNLAASAGLIAWIGGSSTKIVKVTRIRAVFTTSVAAVIDECAIERFSALPTGAGITTDTGTQVAGKADSSDPDPSALAQHATATVTTGPLVGLIDIFGGLLASATTTPTGGPVALLWDCYRPGVKPITLNGPKECVGIQINVATSVTMYYAFEWTEE